MSVKADDVRGALASFAQIRKAAPVEIDLQTVATSIVTDIEKVMDSADPVAGLEGLEKRVGEVSTFLEKASYSDEADIVTAPAGEVLTTTFAKTDDEDEDDMEDTEDEKKPFWAKGKGKGAKKADTAKAADIEYENPRETRAVHDDGKGDAWDVDMSPSKPPVQRAERLTKNEAPMAARPGAAARHQDKYARARERALQGGSDRSMA